MTIVMIAQLKKKIQVATYYRQNVRMIHRNYYKTQRS